MRYNLDRDFWQNEPKVTFERSTVLPVVGLVALKPSLLEDFETARLSRNKRRSHR